MPSTRSPPLCTSPQSGTTRRATGTATITVTAGALDHLVLAPSTKTIAAGDSQAFTARGFDSFDNNLGDVTASTVFTATRRMSCTDATCTSTTPGTYTVTGTNGSATGTAGLTVRYQMAVVVEVIDGDTIAVRLLPGGPQRRVQLIGIAAPGGASCRGPRSSRATSAILHRGTRVGLVADPSQRLMDGRDRLLRYVMKGNRDVGQALVSRGHARVSVQQGRVFQRVKQYRASQSVAKRHHKGLWGPC